MSKSDRRGYAPLRSLSLAQAYINLQAVRAVYNSLSTSGIPVEDAGRPHMLLKPLRDAFSAVFVS